MSVAKWLRWLRFGKGDEACEKKLRLPPNELRLPGASFPMAGDSAAAVPLRTWPGESAVSHSISKTTGGRYTEDSVKSPASGC